MTQEAFNSRTGNGRKLPDVAEMILPLYAQKKIDERDLLILESILYQRKGMRETAREMKIPWSSLRRRLARLRPLLSGKS